MFNIYIFFRKSCCTCDNVEKYFRAGQATDDNMVHALCMLDKWGYKHTLSICNTYCFSTATNKPQLLRYSTLPVLLQFTEANVP
jgi:hypothetical protein